MFGTLVLALQLQRLDLDPHHQRNNHHQIGILKILTSFYPIQSHTYLHLPTLYILNTDLMSHSMVVSFKLLLCERWLCKRGVGFIRNAHFR